MDYYSRLEQSIDYIESNLTRPILLEEVSQRAYSSLSHFHRIFAFMTGLTLKAYIRKRRLSMAAHELICTDTSILDIALKYQYQTHETFTRAFKKAYGCNPLQFRKHQIEHLLFEKIDIRSDRYKNRHYAPGITVRFVTRNELMVSGFGIDTTLEDDRVAKDIPGFMEHFFKTGLDGRIKGKVNTDIFFGVYSNLDIHNNFRFSIGYETALSRQKNKPLMPGDPEVHIIPARDYAVFTARGPMPDSLVNTWHYIYGNWLPNSSYERVSGIDFEVYDTRKMTGTAPEIDIYIPLKIVKS